MTIAEKTVLVTGADRGIGIRMKRRAWSFDQWAAWADSAFRRSRFASMVTAPCRYWSFAARRWASSDLADVGAGLGAGVRRALSSCARELISSLR
jgi:hypothetical protein